MITQHEIKEALPEYHLCEVGDIIKIHTFNFGNESYNEYFSKLGKDTEYRVSHVFGSSFDISLQGTTLKHKTFGQRDRMRNRGDYKFNQSFALVKTNAAGITALKDIKWLKEALIVL